MEFCNNGVWGTVCDHWWHFEDATAVCSQLGHGTGEFLICVLVYDI